ncbi:unnamed protein product [Jaminaea pallidilutea]
MTPTKPFGSPDTLSRPNANATRSGTTQEPFENLIPAYASTGYGLALPRLSWSTLSQKAHRTAADTPDRARKTTAGAASIRSSSSSSLTIKSSSTAQSISTTKSSSSIASKTSTLFAKAKYRLSKGAIDEEDRIDYQQYQEDANHEAALQDAVSRYGFGGSIMCPVIK